MLGSLIDRKFLSSFETDHPLNIFVNYPLLLSLIII